MAAYTVVVEAQRPFPADLPAAAFFPPGLVPYAVKVTDQRRDERGFHGFYGPPDLLSMDTDDARVRVCAWVAWALDDLFHSEDTTEKERRAGTLLVQMDDDARVTLTAASGGPATFCTVRLKPLDAPALPAFEWPTERDLSDLVAQASAEERRMELDRALERLDDTLESAGAARRPRL